MFERFISLTNRAILSLSNSLFLLATAVKGVRQEQVGHKRLIEQIEHDTIELFDSQEFIKERFDKYQVEQLVKVDETKERLGHTEYTQQQHEGDIKNLYQEVQDLKRGFRAYQETASSHLRLIKRQQTLIESQDQEISDLREEVQKLSYSVLTNRERIGTVNRKCNQIEENNRNFYRKLGEPLTSEGGQEIINFLERHGWNRQNLQEDNEFPYTESVGLQIQPSQVITNEPAIFLQWGHSP